MEGLGAVPEDTWRGMVGHSFGCDIVIMNIKQLCLPAWGQRRGERGEMEGLGGGSRTIWEGGG